MNFTRDDAVAMITRVAGPEGLLHEVMEMFELNVYAMLQGDQPVNYRAAAFDALYEWDI